MRARGRPTRSKRHAGFLAISVAIATSCGSVGDPRPPLLNLPRPVEDLSARQVGDAIEISWSWPVTTTEGLIARKIGNFTLWAVDVPGFSTDLRLETIDEYRRSVQTLGPDDFADSGPGNRLTISSPLEDWELGQTTVLVVSVSNATGQDAGYSNQARLQPLEPPGMAEWSAVSVTAEGVELVWTHAARAEEYAIERSSDDGLIFQTLGRLSVNSFLDPTVDWGTTYHYRLRPERDSAAGWIEGPISRTVDVTPEDTFAPAPPDGLRAVRTSASVELSWLPSADEDAVGYLVYRDGEVVSPLVTDPSFSDVSAPAHTALEYAISAVDGNGNESKPSAVLSVAAYDRLAN